MREADRRVRSNKRAAADESPLRKRRRMARSQVGFLRKRKTKPEQGAQKLGSYQSGQMGQTVNLLAYAFGGSNPSLPTKRECRLELQDPDAVGRRCEGRDDSDAVYFCGSSSVDRASAFQAEGREFEPRLPLQTQTRVIRMTPAGVAGTFVSPACSAK